MRYIVDTHSLLWYFTKDSRISKKAFQILQDAERGKDEMLIPIIVLLEAIDIGEKKKVKFDIQQLFEFIEATPNFEVIELDLRLAKEVTRVGKGFDLHDRIIVTVSKLYQAAIITKDSMMKKIVRTVW